MSESPKQISPFPPDAYYIEDDEDEITLKEWLLKMKSYFQEIVRNWLILTLFCVPPVAYMLYNAFVMPDKYAASLTFMVNENTGGSSLGAVSGLLSSFGLGGGGGGGDFNLDKILALSKSLRIMEEALFEKGKVEGQTDYYANHFIKKYRLHEKKWAKDTSGLKAFLFTHTKIDSFNRAENSALKYLYQMIVGDETDAGSALMSNVYDKKSMIMSLSLNTVSEDLTIHFLNTIFNKLSNYYIRTTIEKEKFTYDLLKAKTDSLARALQGKEYTQANLSDRMRGLIVATPNVPQQRAGRDVARLNLMYAESIKNLELADFSLKNKTPFIQAIDLPRIPIKPERQSKVKAILMGCAFGFLAGSIFIIGRKIFRDTMTA